LNGRSGTRSSRERFAASGTRTSRCTGRRRSGGSFAARRSIGDSYDNALAETVIGLYKNEVIRRRGPWRSIDAVEYATLEWVDWFNRRRLLEPLGYVPPVEFEAAYYS
jgi:transposase InsO family protein